MNQSIHDQLKDALERKDKKTIEYAIESILLRRELEKAALDFSPAPSPFVFEKEKWVERQIQ